MTSYLFRCLSCQTDYDIERPIGEAPNIIRCADCGGTAKQVLGAGLMIGAGALPNKRAGVLVEQSKESALGADMDAYKRMRKRGIQPKQIDGARKIEDSTGDNFDVEYGRFYGMADSREQARDRIRSGLNDAKDIAEATGNDWLGQIAKPVA